MARIIESQFPYKHKMVLPVQFAPKDDGVTETQNVGSVSEGTI